MSATVEHEGGWVEFRLPSGVLAVMPHPRARSVVVTGLMDLDGNFLGPVHIEVDDLVTLAATIVTKQSG